MKNIVWENFVMKQFTENKKTTNFVKLNDFTKIWSTVKLKLIVLMCFTVWKITKYNQCRNFGNLLSRFYEKFRENNGFTKLNKEITK